MPAPVVKPVPVVLPIDDWTALKQQAASEGCSASSIVRKLVTGHLRKSTRKGRARADAATPSS